MFESSNKYFDLITKLTNHVMSIHCMTVWWWLCVLESSFRPHINFRKKTWRMTLKFLKANPFYYLTYHQLSSSSRMTSPFLIKPINSPNYLSTSFYNRSVHGLSHGIHPTSTYKVNSLGILKNKLVNVDLCLCLNGSAIDIS